MGFVLLGTRQQGVPVILRKLVIPDRFDPVSPSFTITDISHNDVSIRDYEKVDIYEYRLIFINIFDFE
ncbi:unnamed protein product [Schistosoma curassoni]|uniref:Velvet domain-containing protein n=1 Tax=Schistosoma curassoni TaxID=6186 RepID=A0A183JNU6_9TREM|nr:unnamed protein product [Schistosoma curassoni]